MGLRIQAEHWLLFYPWRVSEQGLAVGVRSQASVRIWGGGGGGGGGRRKAGYLKPPLSLLNACPRHVELDDYR